MATVTLTTVWLNTAGDLGDYLRCSTTNALQRSQAMDGEVLRLAGGGLRLVRRHGIARTWVMAMPWATRAQIDWIEAHIGLTVVARDQRGNKLHAVYLEVPVTENGSVPQGSVQLTLREVTDTEEV